ncbi:hypothetical protein HZH68_007908 [Vespula germanica]|uniref:Uncharacterized protein n=1 Tax=Vespula germanica TaxID=30212 RepID=A0A834K8I9_VESGE|nr:hypothetical protein HZH68_007908 [Vespula germanica]
MEEKEEEEKEEKKKKKKKEEEEEKIIILIHVDEDARNLTYRTMTFRTGYVRGPCPFQFRQSSPYGHDELVGQVGDCLKTIAKFQTNL